MFYSDFDINSFQLPITHSFAPIEDGLFRGMSPYAEITFGYLTGSQTFPLAGGANSPRSVKLSFTTWSALAGGGINVPLGDGLTVRPILLAGYSHVGADAQFSGPNAVLLRSLVGGILNDASLNSALLGGALEVIYERQLAGDIDLTAQGRYNQLATVETGATSRALQGAGSFGVATASVNFAGPTGWDLATHDVRWLGYVKGTWLPNTDPSILGFNAFAEIGGGFQIIAPDVVRGVRGATVRASAVVGPGVTGWLLSAALNF
ncbi:MAG: hypothetical protein AB7F35_09895 [Acetobacteraceae bacterium]